MPGPLLLAGITAGSSLLSGGINALTQSGMNQRQLQFSKDMYAQQRRDSLTDWAAQNEYNSPAAQMKRLIQAGLNPNLVYGNGATATSSQQPRQSQAPSWNPTAPTVDLGGAAGAGISTYYDAQVKEAQVNNMKVLNEKIQEDIINKATDTLLKIVNINKGNVKTEADKLALDTARKTQITTIEQIKANLAKTYGQTSSIYQGIEKTKQEMDIGLQANERAIALNSATVSKAIQEIAYLRASQAKSEAERKEIYQRIENMKKDGTLKALDVEMRQQGIQPSDPPWIRTINKFINAISTGNPNIRYESPMDKGIQKMYDNIHKHDTRLNLGGIIGKQ